MMTTESKTRKPKTAVTPVKEKTKVSIQATVTKPKKTKSPRFLSKQTTYAGALNKGEVIQLIAEKTQLNRKEVNAVFDCLTEIIQAHLHPKSIGEFRLHGLVKLERRERAASPARKGNNPFTGEEMLFKAKPAKKVVKFKALKKLKEMMK